MGKNFRRAGIAAAAAAAPLGLAYRFALAYRVRAGYPRRNPPRLTPTDLGLPFESMVVESEGVPLPAWFIPARDGAPGPAVVLVHGWESARDRTLPLAVFLHAAGFHTLTFDVRGNGSNPAEPLPLSAGEFGADTLAAFQALLERPEVTEAAVAGHSMGAIGAILAAAADPRVKAVVATSGPADPYRLTRQTFRLAHLPIPDVIAYPLAWLTTRVYVRPRGHRVADISAAKAIAQYAGPVLLAHGEFDTVVPPSHMERLAAAARAARADDPRAAPVETLVVTEGQHSWLYEDARLSRRRGRFPHARLRRAAGSRRGRRTRRGHQRRADPGHRERLRGHQGNAGWSADPRQRRPPGRDAAATAGSGRPTPAPRHPARIPAAPPVEP